MSHLNANVHALARARREGMRWNCLLALNASRPKPLSETTLLKHLSESESDVSQQELRREVHYLVLRGLLVIREKKRSWLMSLTREGIDLVEYTTPCEPGIGRPEINGE